MFEDLFLDQLTYGAVMFDLYHENGIDKPKPGPGWCSIKGEDSIRIQNVNELDKDIIWLSNLSIKTIWENGLTKYSNIKPSNYMNSSVGELMREFNIRPSNFGTSISVSTQIISKIFYKVMLHMKQVYDLKEYEGKNISDILKNKIIPVDRNISENVDEALARAYLDIYKVEDWQEYDRVNNLYVILKRPRLSHAKDLLKHSFPLWDEDWLYYGEEELPSREGRIQFLNELGKPYIAKVEIKDFKTNQKINLERLVKPGKTFGSGGREKDRDWLTDIEIKDLSKMANVIITNAFVAGGYQKYSNLCSLPDGGPLSDFSISMGIISECLLLSLGQKSYNNKIKSKPLMSPRAVWLNAIDRRYCLGPVIKLATRGFNVIEYGLGRVVVQIEKTKLTDLDNLIQFAPQIGLNIPLNMFNRKTILE